MNTKSNLYIIPPTFFQQSAITVARQLLGKQLVRQHEDYSMTRLLIQEVEAYDGVQDLANHAAKGKRTPRNEIMFALGGYFYLYWCYGIHLMLNVVCDQIDYPAAVLIRGAGEINGPGKLTKFLQLEKTLNGKPVFPDNGLWFVDTGVETKPSEIMATPRIGISKKAGEWRDQPLRFVWKTQATSGKG
ncbi:DNA-3-methyladenine glycosylase [Halothece sp. PCC 7418]|uniref:DNA-3-methyladenine glycosylase n=1 Tax=Halothece sp. (strain PCC 7418) TaxID=65093 RepID=UPI0002A08CF6|nr:DNA-3-methyladenine glycosylase [Halothece sp. PCC 7418]AFZ45183.1 DNA-3-methyladenine glycosylase [Halothece sp. PCC 7418]